MSRFSIIKGEIILTTAPIAPTTRKVDPGDQNLLKISSALSTKYLFEQKFFLNAALGVKATKSA